MPLNKADAVKLAGGKGAALSKMIQAGFRVPDGFVVTTAAKTMNYSLTDEILATFDKLGAKKVAVRSSAVSEDGVKDAWAGQMDTFLNIDRKSLTKAIEKCWRSAGSERAKAYAKEKGLKAGRVAVVVQEMVDGDVSGVAFSINPISQNKDEMVIEAVRGLADKLVSGETTPQTYVLDRQGEFVNKKLQQLNPLLSKKDRYQLAESLINLEKYFGFPVDAEWTFKNGQLFILQCRPITTLG